MCIYINNAFKYKIIEKKLYDINIYIKFIFVHIAYQNIISKRFNKTIIIIIKIIFI